jgi:mannan endo-1,4-beta-mannosidase
MGSGLNRPPTDLLQENPSALTKWQCSVASAIKDNLQGRTDILVTTGGASYVDTSVQEAYFSCAALDVIAIHAYGLSDLTQTKLKPIVQKAQNAGKKLMMQEWGMCYFDTSNNNCPPGNALSAGTRDANIKKYADEISKSGIPWMYWQIIPNADPHNDYDFEVSDVLLALFQRRGHFTDVFLLQVGINQANWGALKAAAQATSQYASAFDFTKWLP